MKWQITVNYITILLIALVPGCAKQLQKQNKAALSDKAASSFATIETNVDVAAFSINQEQHIEAKITDIPFMVGSTIIKDEQLSNDQLLITGICSYDYKAVSDYYVQEMQSIGWQLMACYTACETTLVFQKPKKVCVVSIRPLSAQNKNSYKSLFYICVGDKDKQSLSPEFN